ncbi:MAG: hypothetical protein AAGI07_14260 [Bacteroidota bacterium]
MYKLLENRLSILLVMLCITFFVSCDDDDDPETPVDNNAILGLWEFESQEIAFYRDGIELDDGFVTLVLAVLQVELSDFEIPEDATFEFMADSTFEGNASGFDTQTGKWLLSSDQKTLNLSSENDLLFIDLESLPQDVRDLFFEADDSINVEVLKLTDTESSFLISGEGPFEVSGFGTQQIRVDLTINLIKN